jgi:hypothetical protein
VGAGLFYAGGQTGRSDEANSRFWQFCESARTEGCSYNTCQIYGSRRRSRSSSYIFMLHLKTFKKTFWFEIRCINSAETPLSCAAQFRLELSSKFSQRLCCLFVKSMFYISDLFPARSDPPCSLCLPLLVNGWPEEQK